MEMDLFNHLHGIRGNIVSHVQDSYNFDFEKKQCIYFIVCKKTHSAFHFAHFYSYHTILFTDHRTVVYCILSVLKDTQQLAVKSTNDSGYS